MAVDANGIFKYDDTIAVSNIANLLNLGLSSASDQIGRLKKAAYFGNIRNMHDVAEIKQHAQSAKTETGRSVSPNYPIFGYATQEKMLVTYDGSVVTRLAGGNLYQYTYLTGNGNHTVTSGTNKILGTTTVTLPAVSQLTLSLSALIFPEGGAAGNFAPVVNGTRIAPNGSYSSYGTNSRLSLWFSWAVVGREGQNIINWDYTHSTGNNGARTILSTVHTWVTY